MSKIHRKVVETVSSATGLYLELTLSSLQLLAPLRERALRGRADATDLRHADRLALP